MAKGTLKEIKIHGGLNETPEDDRDFPMGALFTMPKLEGIPDEFTLWDPPRIKDQQDTDFCTAFATTYASEAQEGVELSPEFQFAMIKKIAGPGWGANLRQAMESLVNPGSIPAESVPEGMRIGFSSRDEIADPKNWTLLEVLAGKHRKDSFLKITGDYDLFDNIRAAMWKSKQEFEKTKDHSKIKLPITGANWKQAWTIADGGIVPTKKVNGKGFGHAFVLNGVVRKNGELMLSAPLSNGLEFGDKGYYFFPREVVNREFKWGAYVANDLQKDVAKVLLEKKWRADSILIFIAKMIAWSRGLQTKIH